VHVPEQITSLGSDIKQVACGNSHCVALQGKGVVYSWGSNTFGELGRKVGKGESKVMGAQYTNFSGYPRNN